MEDRSSPLVCGAHAVSIRVVSSGLGADQLQLRKCRKVERGQVLVLARGGTGRVRARLRLEPGLACGLSGEVRFTISPLQRNKGHTQAINSINIGHHKQQVILAYRYTSIAFARAFARIRERTSRLSTKTKSPPTSIISTMQCNHVRMATATQLEQ